MKLDEQRANDEHAARDKVEGKVPEAGARGVGREKETTVTTACPESRKPKVKTQPEQNKETPAPEFSTPGILFLPY